MGIMILALTLIAFLLFLKSGQNAARKNLALRQLNETKLLLKASEEREQELATLVHDISEGKALPKKDRQENDYNHYYDYTIVSQYYSSVISQYEELYKEICMILFGEETASKEEIINELKEWDEYLDEADDIFNAIDDFCKNRYAWGDRPSVRVIAEDIHKAFADLKYLNTWGRDCDREQINALTKALDEAGHNVTTFEKTIEELKEQIEDLEKFKPFRKELI